MPIELTKEQVMAAAVMRGLTEEARIAFCNRLGAKGSPLFIIRPDSTGMLLGLVVLTHEARVDKNALTFEDIETLVHTEPKDLIVKMAQQDNYGWSTNAPMPPAGYLYQIELVNT